MSNTAKSFDILAISLSILLNYFNESTKLFSDLCLVKFLNTFERPCFFHLFWSLLLSSAWLLYIVIFIKYCTNMLNKILIAVTRLFIKIYYKSIIKIANVLISKSFIIKLLLKYFNNRYVWRYNNYGFISKVNLFSREIFFFYSWNTGNYGYEVFTRSISWGDFYVAEINRLRSRMRSSWIFLLILFAENVRSLTTR